MAREEIRKFVVTNVSATVLRTLLGNEIDEKTVRVPDKVVTLTEYYGRLIVVVTPANGGRKFSYSFSPEELGIIPSRCDALWQCSIH